MDSTLIIVMRTIERIVIFMSATFISCLGYWLYKLSINKGRGNLQANSKLGDIILSGTGPGLLFMAFGAIILLVGLLTGGGEIKEKSPFLDSKYDMLTNLKDSMEINETSSRFSVEDPNKTAYEDQSITEAKSPNGQ